MTETNSARSLRAELASIESELSLALDDVALLERLKGANDRASRLTAERDKLAAALNKEQAKQAKADEANRFAGISNVSVADNTPAESVTRTSFTIRYTAPRWNGFASLPTEIEVAGFGVLPPDVLAYLIEKRPDLIPGKIKALAIDDPRQAFGRYFLALSRGYVAG